jgi:hypothetical protein
LVGLTVEEFRLEIVNPLDASPVPTRKLVEGALKGMGPPLDGGRPLTAFGAWLLALGAYREVTPRDDHWRQVFRVAELTASNLALSRVLPGQNKLSQHVLALRHFHTLCRALFKPDHEAMRLSHGPLRAVGIHQNTGLAFRLAFPYTQSVGGRQALRDRLEKYREEDKAGTGTSGAIYRFEQAARQSVAAAAGDATVKGIWLMEVGATASDGTEETVVQFRRKPS